MAIVRSQKIAKDLKVQVVKVLKSILQTMTLLLKPKWKKTTHKMKRKSKNPTAVVKPNIHNMKKGMLILK